MIGKPQTVQSLNDAGVIIIGSPSTVRERLAAYQELAGFNTVLVKTQFGTLPADMTRRNMEAIAREVLPYFQKATEE
jgi:alkanesulfonate monooxygenase SsuD/methylene tetrahydromethanopterin reductase-like flavin-dependent oxidoreductase (luciferase family)